MSTNLPPRLAQLGDELERAVAAQVVGTLAVRRIRRLRSRGAMAAAIAGTVVLVGAGAAAAVALLSPDDVAHGMPAGAMVFAGVTPVCETTSDSGDTLRCTVDGGVTSTAVADWTGTIETFTDPQGNVGGGCRSEDARGTVWICFAGQKAVTEDLIGPDLLGAHAEGPSVG